jgi:GNAT superfamily N-acetyltransferase
VTVVVRDVGRGDRPQWQVLWDEYNAFYGRSGPTALDPAVTELTWARFFDPAEPVRCVVAVEGDRVVGIAHYLFHRSTTRTTDVCYLQDLITLAPLRGRGIGRMLIEAVTGAAREAGCSRVYWQTKVDNHTARALYDKVAEHTGFIVYTKELNLGYPLDLDAGDR